MFRPAARHPAECLGTRAGARIVSTCPNSPPARTPPLSPPPKSRSSRVPSTVIGIDLGTTNCSVAQGHAESITVEPIAQLVNPGELRDELLLPSFLYVPGPNDFPAGSIELPWSDRSAYVAGVLAQKRGIENPGRLVS